MKLSAITASLAAIAAAAPNELTKRQTENELRSGGRARIGFVYARGSTETGNMVSFPRSSRAGQRKGS